MKTDEELSKMATRDRIDFEIENVYKFKADYAKLLPMNTLRWGCELEVFWKDDVEFAKKEGIEAASDTAYLIALPSSGNDPYIDGIVWCPEVVADKCKGDPEWISLPRLLSFDDLHHVQVIQ